MQKLGVRFSERLNRSLFFFLAVLVHLFIFLAVLGYVVFPAPKVEVPDGFSIIPSKQAPPPTPSTESGGAATSNAFEVKTSAPSPIAPGGAGNPGVNINTGELVGDLTAHGFDHAPKLPAPIPIDHGKKNWVNIPGVIKMHGGWGKVGHQRFPIYLAKYADGDWDCNNYFNNGELTSGVLPNLFAKVKEWSENELSASDIKVVALNSQEIIDHPPPFIFFTGHKDFHLTNDEVANLRKYLQNGGAIWGDDAFAGDGSRFDVAFHREMKRVLPDADLQFEPLPTDHDIFTPKSRFLIEDLPKGMNYRNDPIECINIDGKIAILYTPNDYSDMMTMHLLPGRNEREAQMDGWNHWTPEHPLFTPSNFVWHAAYYRNYAAPSSMTSYKLSMNILVYLMNRYNDELELAP